MAQKAILTGFVVEQPPYSGLFLDTDGRELGKHVALISDSMSAALPHDVLHARSRLVFEPYLGKRVTVQGLPDSGALWHARVMTGLFHSAEIRWFLPEQGRWDAMLQWFLRNGELALLAETEPYVRQADAAPFVKQELPRTDEYLLLPNCETVGVKQRQGRLEVKALAAGPRPFAQDGVAGRVDEWVKWSLKPAASIASALEAELHQSGVWCAVEKRRSTQKYAAVAGGVAPVSPDAWPDAGCNIELTLAGVGHEKESWLTFGFEAFGSADQVGGLLAEAVAHFFAAHGLPPLALSEDSSLSYPAWLARL